MSKTCRLLTILACFFWCFGCAEKKCAESSRETCRSPNDEPGSETLDPGSNTVVDVPDPGTSARPGGHGDFAAVRVFYGTDRAPTGSDEPGKFYGCQRGEISVGICDVSIPRNHRTGQLESPKIWRFEFRENPEKHVVLLRVQSLDGTTFLSELRRTVADSVEMVESDEGRRELGGEAFVFVHGYNVTFEDAARRTAQIAYDLDFRGAPVMYSWPSQGKATLDAYKEDGRTAEWCEENVMYFVTAVARLSGARKVHLIAHSMGNRIIACALRRLAQDLPADQIPKFNEVILTAPDIDAQVFKESIAPRIVQAAERITIYASANDVALKASSLVNTLGDPRLGQGGTALTTFPEYRQIDVVDASDVDTSLFAFKHSYHADSRTVLSDIQQVFDGTPPDQRGLRAIVNHAAWKIGEGHKHVSGLLKRLKR